MINEKDVSKLERYTKVSEEVALMVLEKTSLKDPIFRILTATVAITNITLVTRVNEEISIDEDKYFSETFPKVVEMISKTMGLPIPEIGEESLDRFVAIDCVAKVNESKDQSQGKFVVNATALACAIALEKCYRIAIANKDHPMMEEMFKDTVEMLGDLNSVTLDLLEEWKE